MIRLFVLAAALWLSGGLLMPAGAQGDVDELFCREHRVECAGPSQIDWLAGYWRHHGQVLLGPEQRLSNGVAWRFHVALPTNLAVPRVTWMPEAGAARRANRLFDAIHGDLLLRYAAFAVERRESVDFIADRREPLPADLGRMNRFLQQPQLIGLTFATSRYASYAEVQWEPAEGSLPRLSLVGRLLDLEKGTVAAARPCWDIPDPPFSIGAQFRFADLFELCDESSAENFQELWRRHLDLATRSEAFRRERGRGLCREHMLPAVDAAIGRLSLHLTASGLAVFTLNFSSNAGRNCTFYRSAINPIVIPYRELSGLMRPGPLKDELLKLPASR